MKTRLKEHEQVVQITKLHWLILALPALLVIIFTVLGILFGNWALLLPLPFIGYFIYKWIERNNDVWIVTNLRVIDEYGVFSHNSKESPLEKINNISYSQSFLGRIIGFGDVQIQTAAEIGSTTYTMVEKPKLLKDTITLMQEEYKKFQIREQAKELANAISVANKDNDQEISEEIEKLYNLKLKGILTEEEYNQRKAKLLNS